MHFMRACNVNFILGDGSRVPTLFACLLEINRGSESEKILSKIIEAAADPQDFIRAPNYIRDDERYNNVLNYLNSYLRLDGFALRDRKAKPSLVVVDDSLPVVSELARRAETIGFDTVKRDIDRALANVEGDPEDAITAACSTIESVLCSILDDLGKELPSNKSIMGLFKAMKEPLALSPNLSDLPHQIAEDVKVTLTGLTAVVQGVGTLRTHGGDAHGRKKGQPRVDARIARLSIHAASTVSLFLIETWQHKFPDRVLHRHNKPD